MSFITSCERSLAVSAETAFDWLVNLDSWNRWTVTFRPVQPASGTAEVGRSLTIKIQGSPGRARVRFTVVARPREIAWTGGLPGVVVGSHQFLFHALGPSACRVESIETWTGALTGILKPMVDPVAQRVGEAQLAGFPFPSLRIS